MGIGLRPPRNPLPLDVPGQPPTTVRKKTLMPGQPARLDMAAPPADSLADPQRKVNGPIPTSRPDAREGRDPAPNPAHLTYYVLGVRAQGDPLRDRGVGSGRYWH